MDNNLTPSPYTDKYDNPIYDGDILFPIDSDYIATVFRELDGKLLFENYYENFKEKDCLTLELGSIREYLTPSLENYVVVGNIREITDFHQNPRLNKELLNEINKELAKRSEKYIF